MKIKVKEIVKGCKFESINKGDWIDLKSAEDLHLNCPKAGKLIGNSNRDIKFDYKIVKLGIAMQLPKGYEVIISPRSSTFKKFGILQYNSCGVVDYSYRGNNDQWGMPVVALLDSTINKGDRICQFRIQLSQKANIWQKIKWLFTRKIKFVWVDNFDCDDRGGFGTTGVK